MEDFDDEDIEYEYRLPEPKTLDERKTEALERIADALEKLAGLDVPPQIGPAAGPKAPQTAPARAVSSLRGPTLANPQRGSREP